ncbi:MAG TPA: hypothetical protein VNL35_21405 [Chloroflexota bacterium]|nr:hypothetical protein [Chloroflexota bacterium]
MRGYLTEGRGWLEEALISGGEIPDAVRARVMDGAANLAYEQAIALART